MSKSKKGKTQVADYHMSMHVGLCSSADAITKLYYGEKEFFSGNITANTAFRASNVGLHGGPKKEGGIDGIITCLFGRTDQVLPDTLATRLGRASGATCPGYRGITSLFLTDGTNGGSAPGFYWGSNTPYLKPLWATVQRAPKGLTAENAMISVSGREISGLGPNGWSYLIKYSNEPDYMDSVIYNQMINDVVPPVPMFTGSMPFGNGSPYDLPAGFSSFPQTGWAVDSTNDSSLYLRKTFDLEAVSDVTFRFYGSGSSGPSVFVNQMGVDVSVVWEYAGARYLECTIPAANLRATGNIIFICDWYDAEEVSSNYPALWSYAAMTTPTFSGLKDQANPAHIIYECLTNTDWGMGESSDLIDVASFEDCGVALVTEKLGLSMIWTRQSTVEDFINEVLKHINGMLFTSPRTGKHTLRLIRGDYSTVGLREVNPDNGTITKFSRRVWGETTNEIVVTWTNPITSAEETVSLQDLGNIAMQGAIVSASRNYHGVRSASLAMQLAARELRIAASPVCTVTVELGRYAWDILPADVVSVTWPEYGIDALPMRVGAVDYGRPGDSKIIVTLTEDIFSLSSSHYEPPPSSNWQTETTSATPVMTSRVYTLPAYAVASNLDGGLASLPYPSALAGILAAAPSSNALNYELTSQSTNAVGDLVWSGRGTKGFCSYGALVAPLASEAVSTVSALSGIYPSVASFAWIGNGADEDCEFVIFTAVGATFTMRRGVLDTTPKAWPAGTPIWLMPAVLPYDTTTLAASVTQQYKLLTNTSGGQLLESAAPIISTALTERPHLPIRPANVQANGVGFGDVDATGLTILPITWATRNRLTEEAIVLPWTDGSTPGESGQTVSLKITNDAGVAITEIPNLVGSSYDLNLSAYYATETIRIRAYAERDGMLSLQAHELRVINIDPGMPRVTSSGDVRVTDTGARRVSVLA